MRQHDQLTQTMKNMATDTTQSIVYLAQQIGDMMDRQDGYGSRTMGANLASRVSIRSLLGGKNLRQLDEERREGSVDRENPLDEPQRLSP